MINTNNISKAYSEVYSFINTLDVYYRKKIPISIYNNIKKNRDKSYTPEYTKDLSITSDNMTHEALALITALNLQYWCDNEIKRNFLKQKYIINTKVEKDKYSYENIFNKPKDTKQFESQNKTDKKFEEKYNEEDEEKNLTSKDLNSKYEVNEKYELTEENKENEKNEEKKENVENTLKVENLSVAVQTKRYSFFNKIILKIKNIFKKKK